MKPQVHEAPEAFGQKFQAAGGGMFLLGHSNEDDVMRSQKAHGLMMNFIMMSVCFSVNSGAAVTVIVLCTAHLGGLLGSLILAIFNTMYVLTPAHWPSVPESDF